MNLKKKGPHIDKLSRPVTAIKTGIAAICLLFLILNVVTVSAALDTGSTLSNIYPADGTSPSVSTLAASNITSNTATISGDLTSLGTAGSVQVSFEYGRTTGYGSVTQAQTMTTTGRFSAALTGLSSGSIYHFRAKADGGTSGVVYSTDMTFTTPTPPGVSTMAASNVTATTATLNGNLNTMGSAASINVYFIWGTSTAYGKTTSSVALNAPGPFSINISGLSAGITYHFQAKADGGTNGISSGSDVSFFSTPTSPSVATQTPTSISYTSVTMRGSLTSLGTATSVNAYFEYGTTTAYGSTSGGQTLTSISPYSVNVGGLTPNTTYHYRAVVDGGVNGRSTGTDQTFKTLNGQPPVLGLANYQDVTFDSVVLVGNLETPGTASSVSVYFEYGTTTAYGTTVSASTPSGAGYTGGFTATVTGLQRGTTYHFRAVVNAGTYGTVYTNDMTFVTLGTSNPVSPSVTTGDANSVTANSAALSGNLDNLGSSATTIYVYFEYGTSTSYEGKTDQQPLKATGPFSARLSGLKPGTLYHYRAVASDRTQNVEYGIDKTFNTAASPPAVSSLSAANVTTSSATLEGSLDSLGTAASAKVYFEYGTTTGYGYTVGTQNLTAPAPVSFSLTSLKPGTEYHYRVEANGGTSGAVSGSDITFTTLQQSTVNIETGSLSITPTQAVAGQEVTISVTVDNSSAAAGTYKVSLTVNGAAANSQNVNVPANSSQKVSFSVTRNTPGIYQVTVNGLNGDFTVLGNTTTGTNSTPVTPVSHASGGINVQLFILIAIIVLAVVVVAIMGIFFFEKRRG